MTKPETSVGPEIRSPVILIGAKGVGKSSQAFAMAQRLQVPQVSLDGLAAELYRRDTLFCSVADTIEDDGQEAGGLVRSTLAVLERRLGAAFYDYEEALHWGAVQEALARFGARPCVMDFGAGHTAYASAERKRGLTAMLRSHRPVVLLQPFADLARSAAYLYSTQRERRRLTETEIRYELALAGNEAFATHTVYTGMKSREQITGELIDVVRSL